MTVPAFYHQSQIMLYMIARFLTPIVFSNAQLQFIIIMSNRYHQKRRGYSPSRSRSYERERDKNHERRYRQDKDEKRRYDERRGPRDDRQLHKEHHVSIDWKPKRDNGYRHSLKHSNSRSYSSSSSSSSSYSSSYSRSNGNKKGYARRDERRHSRRSSSRHRDKGGYKDVSRSRSNRKKQYQSRRNDGNRDKYNGSRKIQYEFYRKYDHRPVDSEKQGNNLPSKNQVYQSREYAQGTKTITSVIQKQKQEQVNSGACEPSKQIARMQDESNLNGRIERFNNSYQSQTVKRSLLPKSFPDPIKRESSLPEALPSDKEKDKVSKVAQLIALAKKNIEVKPLTPNFLMLDSYRTMKKFNAETLDFSLLLSMQRDLQVNMQREKAKLFSNQVVLNQRQNARLAVPSAPSDEELSLRTELEALKVSMMNLNHLFRQLHVLQ